MLLVIRGNTGEFIQYVHAPAHCNRNVTHRTFSRIVLNSDNKKQETNSVSALLYVFMCTKAAQSDNRYRFIKGCYLAIHYNLPLNK